MSKFKRRRLAMAAVLACALPVCAGAGRAAQRGAANPIIWADVPDPAVIRVGDVYYI